MEEDVKDLILTQNMCRDIRLHVLARTLSLQHYKHPNEAALIRNLQRLVTAAEECPEAVASAEQFLQLKRNTLKNWIKNRIQLEIGPSLSAEDTACLENFLYRFAEHARFIPIDFFARAVYYLNTQRKTNIPYITIRKAAANICARHNFKKLLIDQGIQLPTQRNIPCEVIAEEVAKAKEELKLKVGDDSQEGKAIADELILLLQKVIKQEADSEELKDVAVGQSATEIHHRHEVTDKMLDDDTILRELYDMRD
ncbi:Hypothetical_protein [Hexamita inflata]|uniref:Hypothetical_protein n=1 Tax=Hexamita inflata TaxID=28002 RepID=A0AA86QPX7_9EUKA|nr:Hypothetical protein HINF_LOCUS51426 [Hexamita inflata]